MADNILLYNTFNEYKATERNFPIENYICYSGLNYYDIEYEYDEETGEEITGNTSGDIFNNIVIMESGNQTSRLIVLHQERFPEFGYDEQTDEEYKTGNWLSAMMSYYEILQLGTVHEISPGSTYYIPIKKNHPTSPYDFEIKRMLTSGNVETFTYDQLGGYYVKYTVYYISGDTASTKYYALKEIGFIQENVEYASYIYGEFTYLYDYSVVSNRDAQYWDFSNGSVKIGDIICVPDNFFRLNQEGDEVKVLIAPFYKYFYPPTSGQSYVDPINPYITNYNINLATVGAENAGNGWKLKKLWGNEIPEESATTFGWNQYVHVDSNNNEWPNWYPVYKIFYKKDEAPERYVYSGANTTSTWCHIIYNYKFYEEGNTGKTYYGGPTIHSYYGENRNNNVVTARTAYTASYPTQMYEISDGKYTIGSSAGNTQYQNTIHFSPTELPSYDVINSAVPGVGLVASDPSELKVYYNKLPLNLKVELYKFDDNETYDWELLSSRKFDDYEVSPETLMAPLIEEYGGLENIPCLFRFEFVNANGNKLYGGNSQEFEYNSNWTMFYDNPTKMIPIEIYNAISGRFSQFATFLRGGTIKMYFQNQRPY